VSLLVAIRAKGQPVVYVPERRTPLNLVDGDGTMACKDLGKGEKVVNMERIVAGRASIAMLTSSLVAPQNSVAPPHVCGKGSDNFCGL
jgi:hypothetical protein